MGQSSSVGIKALKRTDPANEWQVCEQLGAGSYGTVNKVNGRADGEAAAAKLVNLQTKVRLCWFASLVQIQPPISHGLKHSPVPHSPNSPALL